MIAVRKAPQIHRSKGEFNFEWLAGLRPRAVARDAGAGPRREARGAARAIVAASDIARGLRRHGAQERAQGAGREVHHLRDGAAYRTSSRPRSGACWSPTCRTAAASAAARKTCAAVRRVRRHAEAALCRLARGDPRGRRSPYKAIGLRPSRTIALMNGSIPCKLLLFDLYAGSRRPARPTPGSRATADPSSDSGGRTRQPLQQQVIARDWPAERRFYTGIAIAMALARLHRLCALVFPASLFRNGLRRQSRSSLCRESSSRPVRAAGGAGDADPRAARGRAPQAGTLGAGWPRRCCARPWGALVAANRPTASTGCRCRRCSSW